jgi:hypothetical protein
MNRRGAETQSFNEITEQVIGACIEIHKQIGPAIPLRLRASAVI